jgi:hypothetical protein
MMKLGICPAALLHMNILILEACRPSSILQAFIDARAPKAREKGANSKSWWGVTVRYHIPSNFSFNSRDHLIGKADSE